MSEETPHFSTPIGLEPAHFPHYVPVFRASDELLARLQQLLETYMPRSILETGPGLSSILFYQYQRFQRLHPAVVYHSLDHISKWHRQFVVHLNELGFDPTHAYAVRVGENYYNTKPIPEGKKYDLLFLDGPPGSKKRGTPAALRFIRSHVGDHSIVIHDDTHRKTETRNIEQIMSWFPAEHYTREVIEDQAQKPRLSDVLIPRSLAPR